MHQKCNSLIHYATRQSVMASNGFLIYLNAGPRLEDRKKRDFGNCSKGIDEQKRSEENRSSTQTGDY